MGSASLRKFYEKNILLVLCFLMILAGHYYQEMFLGKQLYSQISLELTVLHSAHGALHISILKALISSEAKKSV